MLFIFQTAKLSHLLHSISGCPCCFKAKQERLQYGLERRHNPSFDSRLPEHPYQKKKNAERWFVVITHLIYRSISLGLNKFFTNVNYYQMILHVNGGHVSSEWLKLRVLQLHLHANLIKKWLRWMDKAENGESDNWDVDYHMSRNVIPFSLFLLSQVIEPEKYHQPSFNILMTFTS